MKKPRRKKVATPQELYSIRAAIVINFVVSYTRILFPMAESDKLSVCNIIINFAGYRRVGLRSERTMYKEANAYAGKLSVTVAEWPTLFYDPVPV